MRRKPMIHVFLTLIVAALIFTLPITSLTAYASAADKTIVKVGYAYYG